MNEKDLHRLRRIAEIGRKLEQTILDKEITQQQVEDDYTLQWMLATPLHDIGSKCIGCPKSSKPITLKFLGQVSPV